MKRVSGKWACVLAVAAAMGAGGVAVQDAQAAYIPVGVQQNVLVDTVFNDWEWEVVYQGIYWTGVSIDTVFAGVADTDYIMYAARPTGGDTFTLLAAALASDVRTYTAQHVTHTANDVEWYYNGGSIGFAALGQTIYQSSADVNDTGLYGGSTQDLVAGATRLSWHTNGTSGYGSVPTLLNGGWRAGNTTELNNSTGWERFVLKYVGDPRTPGQVDNGGGDPTDTPAVPEPATASLLAAGGLLLLARRRARA